jgi:hypothetical protein
MPSATPAKKSWSDPSSGTPIHVLYHRPTHICGTLSRFPRQEEKGAATIPTVLWYDQDGGIVAVGAEDPSNQDFEDNLYPIKVEWYVEIFNLSLF